MIRRSAKKGSLLLELMFACAIMGIILPLLIPSIRDMTSRFKHTSLYLEQSKFRSALTAQFDAHWQRLLPASCYQDSHLALTIGKHSSVPTRLSKKALDPASDWLGATDYGACRLSLNEITNPLNITNVCDLNVGEEVRMSTCMASSQGQVIHSSSKQQSLTVLNDAVLGQTGLLESESPFYWYVAEGKSGQRAFWRTPQRSGNSLELWAGLVHFRVYPLLDLDNDGYVDAIDTTYKDFSLAKVKALWVEYVYELPNCQSHGQGVLAKAYNTLRGDAWQYQAPCQGVANHIVELNVEG